MEKYHKTTGTNKAMREDLEGGRQRIFSQQIMEMRTWEKSIFLVPKSFIREKPICAKTFPRFEDFSY